MSIRNLVHSAFKHAAEQVLPPLTKSKFEEKRVLTPDEFVAAGDFLVRACPTWAWDAGDPKKGRPFLPADKQCLVTRGEADAGVDDVPDINELEEEDEAAIPATGAAGTAGAGPGYLRAEEPEDNIVRTRTYDLYITYDQILEDVSEEHARKTITVEIHPNLSITAASIHPCKHAEVMKKLVDNIIEAGKTFPIEHYLVLFLKFIASVVPTIQYDYTMSVGN
eukprot:gene17654-24000_t